MGRASCWPGREAGLTTEVCLKAGAAQTSPTHLGQPPNTLLGTFWSSERRVTGNLLLKGQLGESGPSQ